MVHEPEMGRMMRWGRSFVALVVGLAALGGRADGQALLDFVTFDRIDYIRWAEEPGRALTPGDLGPEFATVGCSISEDRRGCPFGLDAAAAFLPAGTRMYSVRGHPTDFRLAAVWKDRIFLYQAWQNPRAKVGRDLFAIAGKVRSIDVQRGEPSTLAARTPTTISAPADVVALVDMLLRGTVRHPLAHSVNEPRYWLTFRLTDGTTLGRPFFAETSEVLGGVVLPAEFRRILERYLGGGEMGMAGS
jgi:hypothetical protein